MSAGYFERARSLVGVAALLTALCSAPGSAQVPTSQAYEDGIERLVQGIEQAIRTGVVDAYLNLLAPAADRRAAAMTVGTLFEPGVTRAVVREVDRVCGPTACRVMVDVFREAGAQARLSTWRFDMSRSLSSTGAEHWAIQAQASLSTVNGLYRLGLDPAKAYSARGVTVEAEDLRVTMSEGSVFVAEAAGRPTGLVLVGKGEMRFAPSPVTERGQMKIFAGGEQLQASVEALFVRLHPGELDAHVKGLTATAPDPRDLKRAEEVFRENNGRAYSIELKDVSSEIWSLVPNEGDFLAEIYTRKYGPLTYGQAPREAEDILFFDRKARRNIAQYASRARMAKRGPYYSEDDLVDYQVTDYDLDARFDPDHDGLQATVKMALVVKAGSLTHVNVHLAETLTVRSIVAEGIGRVLPLRVRGRNTVVGLLPAVVSRGDRLVLTFTYDGTVASQRLDQPVEPDKNHEEQPDETPLPEERSFIYSNRPYWYPQPDVTAFSTATMRIAVPPQFGVAASGRGSGPVAGVLERGRSGADPAADAVRRFTFVARQPLRYLSCVISPLVEARAQRVRLDEAGRAGAGVRTNDAVDLVVQTNPRERGLGRQMSELAADIMGFYGHLIGDFPYPTLNLALLEQKLPGGHSPAYMAAVNFVSPRANVTWKGDPASIDGFPEYFVAHELAHQWWGQAVGWKNYHEQWLSEGFAQYFAALYAEHARGKDLFQDILRRWQRWAVDKSEQGPVYLGYRVGHIKSDPRLFRAVVYNKSAMVLHMLRRLLGEEAFFRGLRRFYHDCRFTKAGTDDLQRALETESRVSLQRFFDVWIYGDTLPRVRAATSTSTGSGGEELIVRLEQAGTVFDVPVTVSLEYANRPPAEVTVRLAEAQQEFRIPLAGPLRRVDLNRVHVVPFADFAVTPASVVPSTSSRPPRPTVSPR